MPNIGAVSRRGASGGLWGACGGEVRERRLEEGRAAQESDGARPFPRQLAEGRVWRVVGGQRSRRRKRWRIPVREVCHPSEGSTAVSRHSAVVTV